MPATSASWPARCAAWGEAGAGDGAFEGRAPEGHAGLIRSHRRSLYRRPAPSAPARAEFRCACRLAAQRVAELPERTADFYVSWGRCEGGRRAASTELRLAHRRWPSTGRLILSRLQRYCNTYRAPLLRSCISPLLQNAKAKQITGSGAGGCAARRQTQNVLTRNTLEIGVNTYLDPTSPPKESASAVPVPVGLRALIHGFLITPTADTVTDPRCQPYQKWSWGQPSPHGRQ